MGIGFKIFNDNTNRSFSWISGHLHNRSCKIKTAGNVLVVCQVKIVKMKHQHDQARQRLWEDFCSWMKDHCFAENVTVFEISASQFQVETSQGRRLHIDFNADRAGSVTYKFEDGAEHQLQLLVTIRAQAYFATDGKRYSARELGHKFLNDLASNR